MNDNYDIIVSEIVDGTIHETPMDSSSPEAASIPAARRRPLLPEDRTRLGLAQAEARNLEAEEGRSLVGTAGQYAAQVLDTATLGIPSALDETTRQEQLIHREANPTGSVAADAMAWVIPALLAPEMGAASYMTGGGAAARLGLGAERLVGRALGTSSPGLARGLGVAAEGMVDGLVSGALGEIQQANLQGTPIEAERLIANAGFGALMGGTGGAIFGAPMGMMARRAARAEQAAARTASDLIPEPQVVQQVFDPADPMAYSPRTLRREARAVDQYAEAASGVRADDLAIARAYPDAHEPGMLQESANVASHEFQGAANLIQRRFDEAQVPQARLAATFRNLEEAPGVTQAARNEMRDNLLISVNQAIDAANPSGNTNGTPQSLINLRRMIENGNTGEQGIYQMHDAVLHEFATNDTLRASMRSGAESLLPGTFDLATANLTALGPSGQRLARTHQALRQEWSADNPMGRFATYRRAGDGQAGWDVDTAALGQAFETAAGENITRDLGEELATTMQEANARLDAVDGLFGGESTEARVALERAREALLHTDELARARSSVIKSRLQESNRGGFYSALGTNPGALAGGVVGGVLGLPFGPAGVGVGAAIVGTLGRTAFAGASHPMSVIQFLAQVGNKSVQTEARLSSSLGRLEGVLRRGGQFGNTVRRALPKSVVALRSPAQREEEYAAIRDQVRELAANPQLMTTQLADAASQLGKVSPVYAQTAMQAGLTGIQFLQSKLPVADQPSLFSRFEDEEPSLVEMDAFIRFWEGLEDPLGNVDRLAEGTLDVEHVEAMAAVYPQLYAEVRARITEIVAGLGDMPSYQQRMEIGTMLQIPVDRTLDARFVHSMQQTFAQTEQQDQTQTQNTGVTRSVSMQISDDTRTASQSIRQTLR